MKHSVTCHRSSARESTLRGPGAPNAGHIPCYTEGHSCT